jgi:predicted nucleotidyltransferase
MSLADALFPRTKQRILGVLFSQPDRAIHLRELARIAGVNPSSIQREIQTLAEAGIVTKVARGNLQEFQANRECPVFEELCGFARKTFGIADVIKSALEGLPVDVALIFGSIASGSESARSDVDVLIISNTGYREALDRMMVIEKQIGRPINVKHFRAKEFQDLARSGNAFAMNIISGSKIFLKGSANGLEANESAQPAKHQGPSTAPTEPRRTRNPPKPGP